jgi:oxygen-independent coproporphyrinogen-3 oxidase
VPGQRPVSVTPEISARNDGSQAAATGRSGAIGVYVHFPWCLSKCPYCDFVVQAAPREAIDHRAYADAVLRELDARTRTGSFGPLASVFFGGGTPSLWNPQEVGRVLRAIVSALPPNDEPVEVSLESDPSSLDYDRARAYLDVGVNRLSIGVQSLDDRRLRFLGRIHDAEQAILAVKGAVRAGGLRVSTDLMYAVAEQSPESGAAEAQTLVELGATHVSAYSLTIEPGTPFGRLARRGKLPLADDGAMAASFFAIDEALGGAGFEHYEVSNYAAPGQRARHNVGYWEGRDYLGLGCGAYGTLSAKGGSAVRYRNQPKPSAYVVSLTPRAPLLPQISEERLDAATRLRERIMLGLRTSDGLDLEAVAAALETDPYPGDRRDALERLESLGRITRRGPRIVIPREAWIWADATAAMLF